MKTMEVRMREGDQSTPESAFVTLQTQALFNVALAIAHAGNLDMRITVTITDEKGPFIVMDSTEEKQ